VSPAADFWGYSEGAAEVVAGVDVGLCGAKTVIVALEFGFKVLR
jgi:hypothetical protein